MTAKATTIRTRVNGFEDRHGLDDQRDVDDVIAVLVVGQISYHKQPGRNLSHIREQAVRPDQLFVVPEALGDDLDALIAKIHAHRGEPIEDPLPFNGEGPGRVHGSIVLAKAAERLNSDERKARDEDGRLDYDRDDEPWEPGPIIADRDEALRRLNQVAEDGLPAGFVTTQLRVDLVDEGLAVLSVQSELDWLTITPAGVTEAVALIGDQVEADHPRVRITQEGKRWTLTWPAIANREDETFSSMKAARLRVEHELGRELEWAKAGGAYEADVEVEIPF